MKNKLLSFLIFSLAIIGLFLYYIYYIEPNNISSIDSSEQTNNQINLVSVPSTKENIYESEESQIQQLIDDKTYIKTFDMEKENFYFDRDIEGYILLNSSKNTIATFPYKDFNKLELRYIYGNTELYLLEIDNLKYIIDSIKGVIAQFELVPDINYIKKDQNNFMLVTDKGSFKYDVKSNKVKYQQVFSDFIQYDSKSYVGIIKPGDSYQQDYFDIESKEELIVYYNVITKEKEILLTSEQSLSKIYKSGKAIYFETKAGEILRLRNFDK